MAEVQEKRSRSFMGYKGFNRLINVQKQIINNMAKLSNNMRNEMKGGN